jgi:hypothetical protein
LSSGTVQKQVDIDCRKYVHCINVSHKKRRDKENRRKHVRSNLKKKKNKKEKENKKKTNRKENKTKRKETKKKRKQKENKRKQKKRITIASASPSSHLYHDPDGTSNELNPITLNLYSSGPWAVSHERKGMNSLSFDWEWEWSQSWRRG